MSRTELAERLRRSREALGWVFPGQFRELVENLDAAISYFNNDSFERDVTRYRRLRDFAVEHWLESHRHCFYLRLLAPFHPYPRYGQVELTTEEADMQFDKTLDAWIQEQKR